jgi:SAM-dependent methyltransferase
MWLSFKGGNMEKNYGSYDAAPFIAEYYDVSYNRRTDVDVVFYTDLAKGTKGPILELGCGTGRILIPTARAGYDITGLDYSRYMLDRCRDKLSKESPDVQKQVHLVQGDMTDFSLGKKFDLIIMPFRPFQHLLAVEEQKACLNSIHKHLASHGRFVFDLFNPNPLRLVRSPEYEQESQDFPEISMSDGRKVKRHSRTAAFHRESQYNEYELIYYVTHPDGRQERLVDSFTMRYFFRYEVEHLLELCDFKIIDFYGNFEKAPFISDSPEMIFVAGKK